MFTKSQNERLSSEGKSGVEGVDAPCSDDRCGYCSSENDSIFNEEANQLSRVADENTLSNSLYRQ